MMKDEPSLNDNLHFDVHLIPERQEQSFERIRWKNIPTQFYPGGYIATSLDYLYLFNIPDYTQESMTIGLSKTAMDIARMNIIFMGEESFLKEKISTIDINMPLLQNPSIGFDDPEKNAELKKLATIFPEDLSPRLQEFLLYNLHQDSLCASPAMVLLKKILAEEYKYGLSARDRSNFWIICIQKSTDGKSFSITNTHVITQGITLVDDQPCDLDIEISSVFSFYLEDDEKIQVKCDEVTMQSSDRALVKLFGDRISAQLNQEKAIYKPPKMLDLDLPATPKRETLAIEISNNKAIQINQINQEIYSNAHHDSSTCENAIKNIFIAFKDTQEMPEKFLTLMINIQKKGFKDFSAEQLARFHKILPLLTSYGNSLVGNTSDEEACQKALSLNERLIDYFYLEVLGGDISRKEPFLDKMKISREETQNAVDNNDITYKLAAGVVQQANLELVNCLNYLISPQKNKFEPVSQKKDWNKLFKANIDLISPKKKWAYGALMAIGVTLAVGLGVALVAGVAMTAGGLAVPLAATAGFALSQTVSPAIAVGAVGLVASSIMGISIAVDRFYRKDVALAAKKSRAYLHSAEHNINSIKEPLEKQKIRQDEKSVNKKQNCNSDNHNGEQGGYKEYDPTNAQENRRASSSEVTALSSTYSFFTASEDESNDEIADEMKLLPASY